MAALQAYEHAFQLDTSDARVLFELDQLYKKSKYAPEQRLAFLEPYAAQIDQRDDLTVEWLSLLNLVGRHSDALQILLTRVFHPWEGGEGKVAGQYMTSLVEIAKHLLQTGEATSAVDCLQQALVYPDNLGEGKLVNAGSNHIHYYLGLAYSTLGQVEEAKASFLKAASGAVETASQLYYNDQPPDMMLYQGLARIKLGRTDEAKTIFEQMVKYGQAHLDDQVSMDYFAVSLPDFLVFDEDLQARNQLHCRYMISLGSLGLGDRTETQRQFDFIVEHAPHHLGAVIHRKMLADTQPPLANSISAKAI